MSPVRALIVDDSAVMRSFLRDVLSTDLEILVVGVAGDAIEARTKIRELSPDVLTLDVEMPGMDGIGLLEHVMRLKPTPAVMVSSLTQRGAETTLRALEAGAVDFSAKPLSDSEEDWRNFTRDVVLKVKAAAKAIVPWENAGVLPQKAGGQGHLAAIGGSTGSVPVIQNILKAMPKESPAILIAVHMPARFTTQFAERLNGLCAMEVVEAADGDEIIPGHAYVAPGGAHLAVTRKGRSLFCTVEAGPRVNGHAPSVDVLFDSVARSCGAMATGLLLSGMGRDGAVGLKSMRLAGALTGCQDESSSLIYGMPKAAKEEGAVIEEPPLAKLAQFLMRDPAER